MRRFFFTCIYVLGGLVSSCTLKKVHSRVENTCFLTLESAYLNLDTTEVYEFGPGITLIIGIENKGDSDVIAIKNRFHFPYSINKDIESYLVLTGDQRRMVYSNGTYETRVKAKFKYQEPVFVRTDLEAKRCSELTHTQIQCLLLKYTQILSESHLFYIKSGDDGQLDTILIEKSNSFKLYQGSWRATKKL